MAVTQFIEAKSLIYMDIENAGIIHFQFHKYTFNTLTVNS